MKKHILPLISLLLVVACTSSKNYNKAVKESQWLLKLHLNDSTDLPIAMKMGVQANSIYIENGDEKIACQVKKLTNDSIQFALPVFDQEFLGVFTSDTSIVGSWFNYAKAPDYSIPFTATENHIKPNKNSFNITGKWQTEFSAATADAFKAIGIFTVMNSKTVGSFITETGDFRYLQGNIIDNKLNLACLDGSHAFLFTADVLNDSTIANGKFYSGKHYQTTWYAKKDSTASLKNPYEISRVDTMVDFTFTATTVDSLSYKFTTDSIKDKVTIVQILGTWCPNCMDESRYYQKLINQYGADNLHFIGVAFENGNSHEEYVENINRFTNSLKLTYPVMYAGRASKKVASEVFPMLNEVVSFPTSIIFNKKGKIEAVHTGFYGPGTGDYFYHYQDKTERLLEKLLAE